MTSESFANLDELDLPDQTPPVRKRKKSLTIDKSEDKSDPSPK